MMEKSDKIIRFLKSIHIENIDDFDMDFEMIGRNRFNPKQFDMIILKDTPWKYYLLREFQDAVVSISYPYSLRFSYRKRPVAEDIIELFGEWYQTLYRIPHHFHLVIKKEYLIAIDFKNEEEKTKYAAIVNDFKDFLKFINYEFVIVSTVGETKYSLDEDKVKIENSVDNNRKDLLDDVTPIKPEIEIKIEKKNEDNQSNKKENTIEEVLKSDNIVNDLKEENNAQVDKIEEVPPVDINIKKDSLESFNTQEPNNANEEIDKDISDDGLDGSVTIAQIQKANDELTKEVEERFLALMRENYVVMQKERERARLNKKGGYVFFETIDSINEESGSVDFNGKMFSIEEKDFGKGHIRETIGVHDNIGGAIYVSIYQNKTFTPEVVKSLKNGSNLRVRGVAYRDEFTHQLLVKGHYIDPLPNDNIEHELAETPRVELHLHSKMSSMDGINTMEDYCNYAKALGHNAIAITDHAVVQGYPEAQAAAKKTGIKMLYGCEFYMVDEKQEYIKNPCKTQLNKATYVVLDLETTGLSSKYDRIIEFGAVKVEHGIQTSSLDILINPGVRIPDKIVEITDITNEMVANEPSIEEVMPQILEYLKDAILVTHNANFDFSFLQETLKRLGKPILENPVVDTLALSRYLFPESRKHTLGSLCRNMEVKYDEESAHRADYDAMVLNEVWQPMIVLLNKKFPNITHEQLMTLETPKEMLMHIRPNHVIVFAKNKDGLKDLYKLVSFAHVDYLAEVPKIPRRLLQEHRTNLLIGSACFNGEIFNIARYYNDERLKSAMQFYDYVEIQPLANYSHLINMRDLTEDELLVYINDIVRCADEINKPVVATGDVHYLRKEDKIFRDVYISAKGLGGAPHPLNPYSRTKLSYKFANPDQHYRSTDEMLECMSFLGEEKAYEIVVTNSNAIANQIEEIIPVPNDHLYTPKIDNCENILKDMCFNKAKELYGDPLPEFIENRLNTELNGIINGGYSVIYYIAHRLVKKSNEDGFIVGSRGSVGSSFVATMSGITEVNPLPPHYRCPHCRHLEWTSETMPEYKSGYDLPDKKCPICGENMVHDGQNIPFETFLGFHAEKVPDIDLNFPADYQAKAHNYTKVLLGAENVFRAGTIAGVEDKTAFGFARGFIERSGVDPDSVSRAKIAYLASGCIGTKRTTGQHPGGIVVVPNDHDVYDFTPVQYPADDKDAAWKTTHFDFHSIHDTILKLDLLGHVDPMALKMMCELTGVAIKDIPMNDKKVLSLFSSPKALNMENDYSEAKTGALAIPEFGTEFVRGILEDTRPKTFNDLVIISGLSHGTDVWNGNAETLIKNGQATLQEVIGCRDDIMTYLISMGLPSEDSFFIMEDVRKGRGLKEKYVELMKANKVPQYYIDSCNLIKYMFPKGHAVAYVTMAIRVGYFKIYYPLEFYATFFSVRSKQYDIKPMLAGREGIIARLEELKNKRNNVGGEKLSNKEAEQLKTLNIALEMVQRGFKFANIDLYRSDATKFVVDRERKSLIPPFDVLDNLGENNAVTVIEARQSGEFYSIEDLQRRTKLSQKNIDDLRDLGVLDGLNENDQLTLF